MKHLISTVLFYFLSSCAGPKISNPFLWKATKGSHEVYLFGTLHRGISTNDLPPQFFTYLDSSKIFIMESAPNSNNVKHFDSQLKNYASRKSLQIEYLETSEDVSEFLEILNESYIRIDPKELRKLEQKQKQISAKYKATDVEYYKTSNVFFFIENAKAYMPESVKHLILTERHNKWMSTILSAINSKEQIFIAVGILHLLNNKSNLIDRFKRQGYTVKRVDFTPPPSQN